MKKKNELPEGWACTQLLDITNDVKNVKPEDEPDRNFKYVDISSIDNRMFVISDCKTFKGRDAPSRARRPIKTNDVLFSNVRTYLKNIAIVGEEYDNQLCSTGFTVLRPSLGILPKFMFTFVQTDEFIDSVTPQQRGSQYPATSDTVVKSAQIHLPPLPEQQRIVAAIEALFARLDATNERLDRMPKILKTFRQALLAAACDGRLTEDWRFNHISPKNLLLIGDTLPEGWSISKIKDVFEYWGGATPSTSNPLYWNGEIPWISSKDMKTWKISKGQKFITLQALENTNLRKCPVNSVLVVVRSGILLHTLPIAITESEVVINQDLKAFYNQDHDLNNWLAIFLKGKSHEILYNNRKDGTTVQSIKFDDLKNMDLLIPSKEEQKEIVRRLDALFAFADSVEAKVAVAKEKTEQLRRSILAKAFSGELVPTEAELARQEGRDYESAEMMLERVKAERVTSKKK